MVTGGTTSVGPVEPEPEYSRQIAREDAVKVGLLVVDVPTGPKLLGGFAPKMLPDEPNEPELCELVPCVPPNIDPLLGGLLPNPPPPPKVLVPVPPPNAPNPDAGLG